MKYLFWIIICFTCLFDTVDAQEVYSKLGIYSGYMPNFTVQEASDSHVQPIGVRLMISDYNMMPFEFGVNASAHYGETARLSFGVNLAYLFAERNSHDFKIGVNLSKIEIEDVLLPDDKIIGPQVGDVRFQGFGNEIKPFIEWEWLGSQFASLFLQVGYRIINGEKTVVTAVEEVNNPKLGFPTNKVRERDSSFFYSSSGFEIGFGVSIHLLRE